MATAKPMDMPRWGGGGVAAGVAFAGGVAAGSGAAAFGGLFLLLFLLFLLAISPSFTADTRGRVSIPVADRGLYHVRVESQA